jgi:hypothetical protein
LLLSMIVLEVGFTPPLLNLSDNIVGFIFVLYFVCAAIPPIRWLLKPDVKRLNPKPHLNTQKPRASKARNRK